MNGWLSLVLFIPVGDRRSKIMWLHCKLFHHMCICNLLVTCCRYHLALQLYNVSIPRAILQYTIQSIIRVYFVFVLWSPRDTAVRDRSIESQIDVPRSLLFAQRYQWEMVAIFVIPSITHETCEGFSPWHKKPTPLATPLLMRWRCMIEASMLSGPPCCCEIRFQLKLFQNVVLEKICMFGLVQ